MDAPGIDSTATHASRNPNRSILPTRPAKQNGSKTQAQKNAAALKQVQAREKNQLLSEKIEAYYQKEEKEVEEIAEATGFSSEHVRRMLKTAALKRVQKREASIHIAVSRYKMQEANKCTYIWRSSCRGFLTLHLLSTPSGGEV